MGSGIHDTGDGRCDATNDPAGQQGTITFTTFTSDEHLLRRSWRRVLRSIKFRRARHSMACGRGQRGRGGRRVGAHPERAGRRHASRRGWRHSEGPLRGGDRTGSTKVHDDAATGAAHHPSPPRSSRWRVAVTLQLAWGISLAMRGGQRLQRGAGSLSHIARQRCSVCDMGSRTPGRRRQPPLLRDQPRHRGVGDLPRMGDGLRPT
mmetsp:Transcript_85071/g.214420  ORF Transcript_85071/g.214420 Transcript_85071/m.214420 type:complete len:206 (+) Transcript_85071:2557-3174(+)